MRTVPGPVERVLVIGAGLGGLSAALHLTGAGREVVVLEREAEPGGRAGVLRDGGFAFDTGPTVLTMPGLIGDALAAVGESLDDWLTLRRLDPAYRARFADGSTLDVRADVDATCDAIEALCGGREADGFRRFAVYARDLYRLELPHFIDRNLDSPLALLRAPMLDLVRMGGFARLAPKVASFVRDERLRRLLTFQAMYAGLAPAQALALYAVITYMDCVAGVFFPTGGMHAVARAMAGAAEKHGASLRYRTAAARIEVRDGRAQAVITSEGERIPADAVVVNADLPAAERDLLARRPRRLRYAPSCVVLHVGSGAAYPGAAHHTISFGAAWQGTFDEIIRQGRVMSDPSFLLSTPTLSDPSLAPAGKHAYYALFPCPNLDQARPIDWTREQDRYRDAMIAVLRRRGLAAVPDSAEVMHLTTPADWRARGLAAGTPFGAAHTFAQTGPFRFATLDRHIRNLLWCGSNVQPGVGVPMVILSGRLAAERITAVRSASATIGR